MMTCSGFHEEKNGKRSQSISTIRKVVEVSRKRWKGTTLTSMQNLASHSLKSKTF